MLQQPALDAELETLGLRTHEAPDTAARGDHAVARHDERDGIGAACAAHGTRRGAQLLRELSIRARLPRGNALHRLPHREPMMRTREAQRQIEGEAAVVEIR